MRRAKPAVHGVTLIELIIALVIISILAAIAYPSYVNYTRQTRRSDAQIALTQAAALQEKYYTECNTYAQTLAGARSCATGILGYAPSTPVLSPGSHYEITLVAPTASSGNCPIDSCYILQANPDSAAVGVTGRQKGDGRYRIDSRGNKTWDKANTNSPDSFGKFVNKWTDK